MTITIKRLILYVLLQVYMYSLAFHTMYGIAKSGNEYFCLQKRADTPDFTAEVKLNSINVTNGYIDGASVDRALIAANDKFILFSRIGSDRDIYHYNSNSSISFESYGDKVILGNEYELDYSLNDNFFSLKCTISQDSHSKNVERPDLNKGFHLIPDTAFGEDSGSIKDSGFLAGDLNKHHQKRALYMFKDPKFMLNRIECVFKRSPSTCTTKIETTNTAFLCYMIGVLLLVILFLLSHFDLNRFLIRRLVYNIKDIFQVNLDDSFCNPMTGKPVLLGKGEKMITLGVRGHKMPHNSALSNLKDKNGEYHFDNEGNLLIKTKDESAILECDHDSRKIISNYFSMIFMDHKKCAGSDTEGHYHTTLEVIKHLLNGGGLVEKTVEADVHMLNVDKFEFNYLKSMFKMADTDMAKLLVHNRNFFSGYNLEAVCSCIKRRTWSSQAPRDVGNSQWKRYTSDFKILMSKLGYPGYKCQKDYKPTQALLKTEASLDEEFYVEKSVGVFSIKENIIKEKMMSSEMKRSQTMPNSILGIDPLSKRITSFESYDAEAKIEKDYIVRAQELTNQAVEIMTEPLAVSTDTKGSVDINLTGTSVLYAKDLHDIEPGLNILRGKVEKTLNLIKSYKDVLLEPPEVEYKVTPVVKPVQKKGKRTVIPTAEPTTVIRTVESHEKLKRNLSRTQICERLTTNLIKIKHFDKIKTMLEENEREYNKLMQEQHDNYLKFTRNDLNDALLKCTKLKKKLAPSYQKKGKNNKTKSKLGSHNMVEVKKMTLVNKKWLNSSNFKDNFNKSLSLLGFKNADGSEITFEKENIRPRTFHNICRNLESCLGKMKTSTHLKNEAFRLTEIRRKLILKTKNDFGLDVLSSVKAKAINGVLREHIKDDLIISALEVIPK